jgi:hypothetical protein
MTNAGHLFAKTLRCIVFPVLVAPVPLHGRGRAGKKSDNVEKFLWIAV